MSEGWEYYKDRVCHILAGRPVRDLGEAEAAVDAELSALRARAEKAEAEARPREAIYAEIETERLRQDAKWGEQNHPIRDEEVAMFYQDQAEYWRKICDIKARQGNVTWFNILIEEFFEAFAESDPAKQREELKQVAAVAVAMMECIDRRALAGKGE